MFDGTLPRLVSITLTRPLDFHTDKFYALTEPVMKSVLSNDLTAELPFDVSEEEVRIISHFETATLILGRSGTGKTTCLVYKLLSKYLAGKSVPGGTSKRQVCSSY